MRKFFVMLLVLAFAALFVAACGDDDDDGGGGGGDPFSNYDCDTILEDSEADGCDYQICTWQDGFEQGMAACEDAGADCGFYATCMTDYVECYDAACPDDGEAMTACSTDYTSCITSGAQ